MNFANIHVHVRSAISKGIVLISPLPVFHREPLRPRWSTAISAVHREIDSKITPAVINNCHRDLSRWKHLQVTVIYHADEKFSTLVLCFRQKSRCTSCTRLILWSVEKNNIYVNTFNRQIIEFIQIYCFIFTVYVLSISLHIYELNMLFILFKP